jgi:hypothetical protein
MIRPQTSSADGRNMANRNTLDSEKDRRALDRRDGPRLPVTPSDDDIDLNDEDTDTVDDHPVATDRHPHTPSTDSRR